MNGLVASDATPLNYLALIKAGKLLRKLPLARRRDSASYSIMNVPLTAEIHREGEWFIAFCPEVPEANGQGRTQEECLASLREAILLLMEDRREDAR